MSNIFDDDENYYEEVGPSEYEPKNTELKEKLDKNNAEAKKAPKSVRFKEEIEDVKYYRKDDPPIRLSQEEKTIFDKLKDLVQSIGNALSSLKDTISQKLSFGKSASYSLEHEAYVQKNLYSAQPQKTPKEEIYSETYMNQNQLQRQNAIKKTSMPEEGIYSDPSEKIAANRNAGIFEEDIYSETYMDMSGGKKQDPMKIPPEPKLDTVKASPEQIAKQEVNKGPQR
ncbi:hypothetical protein GUI12_02820 [Anaplasmataceae bacterium AB001_6]|nr:hypothetical protein GUI12_02820 [Anaplasmataceae bacterium AB001_6]